MNFNCSWIDTKMSLRTTPPPTQTKSCLQDRQVTNNWLWVEKFWVQRKGTFTQGIAKPFWPPSFDFSTQSADFFYIVGEMGASFTCQSCRACNPTQPPKNCQKRPFLAQNSHFGHFCLLDTTQTWTTLSAQNASEELILWRTNSIRSKIGKTQLKMAKTSKMAIFSPKNTISGHLRRGVGWGFVTCNSNISKKHPFLPQ